MVGKIMGNEWRGWKFFYHGLPGWARIGGGAQGSAWEPSCAGFSNPFASNLARDCETPPLILLRKLALRLRLAQKLLGEKSGLRLVSKRG